MELQEKRDKSEWKPHLKLANQVRSARKDTLEALRTGELTPAEALEREELQTMTIEKFVCNIPWRARKLTGKKYGDFTASRRQVVRQIGASYLRNIGELTERQRQMFVAIVEQWPFYRNGSC